MYLLYYLKGKSRSKSCLALEMRKNLLFWSRGQTNDQKVMDFFIVWFGHSHKGLLRFWQRVRLKKKNFKTIYLWIVRGLLKCNMKTHVARMCPLIHTFNSVAYIDNEKPNSRAALRLRAVFSLFSHSKTPAFPWA